MAWKASLLFLSLLSTFVLSNPDHEGQHGHDNDDSEKTADLPGYVPSVFTVPSGRLSIEPCTIQGVSAICWISDGVTLNSPAGSEVTSGVPPAITDPAIANTSTASNTSVAWDKTILVNNNSTTTVGQAASTTGNNLTTTILVEGTSSTTLFPNATQAGPINTAPPSGTATASQGTGTGTGFVSPSAGWNTSSCSGYVCPGGPQPSWTGWSGRPRPTGGFPPPFTNATGTGGVSINATVSGGISTSYRVTSTVTSSIWVSSTGCCNASSSTTDDGSVIGPINTASSPPFSNGTISQPTASSSPTGTISLNGTASIQPTGTGFPNGTISSNVTSFAPTASGSTCWTLANSTWTRLSTCTGGPAASSPWLDWNSTAPFPTGTGASNATRPTLTGTGGPDTNATNSAGTGTEGAGSRPPRPTDASTDSNSTMSSTSSVSNTTTPFPSGGTGPSTTINFNATISSGTGVSSTTTRPSTGDGTSFPSATANATFQVTPSTNSSTTVVGPGTGTAQGTGTGTISYSANGTATRTATVSASVSNTANVNATAPFPSPPVDTTCTTSTSTTASSNFTIPPGPGVSRPPPASGSSASASTTTPSTSSTTSSSSTSSSGSLDVSATFTSPSSSSSSSSPSYTLSSTGTTSSPSSSLTTISASPDPSSDGNATRSTVPSSTPPVSFSITTTVDRGVLQCVQSMGPLGETLGSSCLTTLETSVLATSRTSDNGGVAEPGETGGGDWGYWGDQQRGVIVEREVEEAVEVVEMEEHGETIGAQPVAEEAQGARVREVVRRGMRIPEGTLGYGGGGGVYGREAVGAAAESRGESEVDMDRGAAAAMDTGTSPSHVRGWLQRMLGL